MTDYEEFFTPVNNEEDGSYSLIGEADGQGNIVFTKHYRGDLARTKKAKAIKIPTSKFWGTAEAVKNGTYVLHKLPPKKEKSTIKNEEVKKNKLRKKK